MKTLPRIETRLASYLEISSNDVVTVDEIEKVLLGVSNIKEGTGPGGETTFDMKFDSATMKFAIKRKGRKTTATMSMSGTLKTDYIAQVLEALSEGLKKLGSK